MDAGSDDDVVYDVGKGSSSFEALVRVSTSSVADLLRARAATPVILLKLPLPQPPTATAVVAAAAAAAASRQRRDEREEERHLLDRGHVVVDDVRAEEDAELWLLR